MDSSTQLQSQKLLILFKGHPGVGKSTLAHALALKLQCPIIDKDCARDSLSLISETINGVRRVSILMQD